MVIIIMIAVSIGLAVNHRMLLAVLHGGTSAPVPSPSVSSADNSPAAPAGLLQVRELYQKDQALFVDAREKPAFDAAHIRKAVSLPVSEFERKLPEFRKRHGLSTRLVVYCSGYGCRDSRLLADKLVKTGYHGILVFEGGLPEWKDAGLPVEGTNK